MKPPLMRLLVYLTWLLLPAAGTQAVEIVFFWGNNATPPIDLSTRLWVAPTPLYASAAASAHYGRTWEGEYAVDHFALDGGDTFSAAVLLKPYGTSAVCGLRDANRAVCFDPSGAPQNTRFLYFWATAEPYEADILSYGRVDTAGGHPNFYQYGIHKPGAVSRIDTGVYVVKLGGAATFESSVQVQHVDNHGRNVNCNPIWWYRGSVIVRCVHRLGFPVDYGFRLIAASGKRWHSYNHPLFDVATQRSYGPDVSLDTRFSQASDGSDQSVVRLSTGTYRLRLGPSANPRGHVQVTSMDYDGAECHVNSFAWGNVQIACTRNGRAADSPFTVMGATPLTGAVFPSVLTVRP